LKELPRVQEGSFTRGEKPGLKMNVRQGGKKKGKVGEPAGEETAP